MNWAKFSRLPEITKSLKQLYGQYGYKPIRLARFEEYELYLANKNFLKHGEVITFMNTDGRLLSLKPDVTLSVIKSVAAQSQSCNQKVFYSDYVYRPSGSSRSYDEFYQIGLEYIGSIDEYALAEIAALAAKSLAVISPDYLLELSHVSFVSGLLDGVDEGLRKEIMACITAKSLHGLESALEKVSLDDDTKTKIRMLIELGGDFKQTLQSMRGLAINEQMETAARELETIYRVLERIGLQDNIKIDFSMIDDIEYYNGIVLRGYIKEIPTAVLRGGRYDCLVRKQGYSSNAMGFALTLNDIDQKTKSNDSDIDVLIEYDSCDPCLLAETAERLTAEGKTVRAEKIGTGRDFTYREVYRI